MEKFNQKPIHIAEGYVLFNGVRVYDAIKCTITMTPKTMTSMRLGSVTPDTRWGNTREYKVEITRRRTTSWTRDMINEYKKTGITPELTICGVQSDKDSDFYEKHGDQTVTALGCVPTGDIKILELDADGEWLDDVMTLNAKDVILT